MTSSTERWAKMEERFSKLNVDVTRFPAAIGGTDDIIDKFDSRLNNGEKGCGQSHINVWRHIVNENLPYALVLEDDACFDTNWRDKLELFSRDINDSEWDMILLNASEPCSPIDKWVLCKEQYLTAGYIISLKGAKTILGMFPDYFFASDWMTSRIQLHNHSYCYFPWLIIQEGTDSTIRGDIFKYHYNKAVTCLNEINYDLNNYII
jgi:glycosyl transferase family 25